MRHLNLSGKGGGLDIFQGIVRQYRTRWVNFGRKIKKRGFLRGRMTKIIKGQGQRVKKGRKLSEDEAILARIFAEAGKTDEDLEDVSKLRYKSAAEEIRVELRREIRGAGELGRGMKLPAILSREECFQLMSAYNKGKFAFRNNLISRLLYSTGMRVEELENLKLADISYDAATIFVRSGKGEKDRYVCVDEGTLELLREWQKGKDLADLVIGLSLRQIRRVVERAGEMTGISVKYEAMGRVFSTHSFRHAFATHSYENGMRTLTLKKLLGHEYLGTTQIYIYTAMKYDVEEYKRTSPLRGEVVL